MERFDIDAALDSMDVEEKASLLAGKDFWHLMGDEGRGIPSIMMTDGPHGLRKQLGDADHLGLNVSAPATCFPTASLTACSFDRALLREMGEAIGEECRREDVGVLLGPGVNIKRSPLCGRNFEYFSEDPLLAGEMAAAFIEGVQSRGVGTSLKHFCANSQEKARLVSDSVIDDRTLNEIYLKPFEIAVKKARPWTIMGAYNKLNGTHCTENGWLLNEKLRGEWGFDGAVVTDWGAANSYEESLGQGLDITMPGPDPDYRDTVADLVRRGVLWESDLDTAARRVLELIGRVADGREEPCDCDRIAHLELARRVARESIVLLENDGTLPIAPGSSVAVIGGFAKKARYQGAGSSKINPFELDNALGAFMATDSRIRYAEGYDLSTGATSPDLLVEAMTAAASCDVAVVFAGLPDSYESEGYDRDGMEMPEGHVELIERVCAVNPRTVVVLAGGAPMEMPWRGKPAAVLLAYLAGCQGGKAIVDLLTGLENPSGKLAETWPAALEDTALGRSFPCVDREIYYTEGIYVGYRYFDAAGVEPAYPFGYGLSYTTFEYSGFDVAPVEGRIRVALDVSNTGGADGMETVQVYVHAKDPAVYRAEQWLAGFEKVRVPAGGTVHVEIDLGPEAFSYWDAGEGRWRIDAGSYEIRASASSRDVRCRAEIALSSVTAGFDVDEPPVVGELERALLSPYYDVEPHMFDGSQEDDVRGILAFVTAYGRELPQIPPLKPYTLDSVMMDMGQSFFGRMALAFLRVRSREMAAAGDEDVNKMREAMMQDMPLRMAVMGGMPHRKLAGFVKLINGDRIAGLRDIFGK